MVFLTHAHPDHIGWACTHGIPNFPNAKHCFPKAELLPLQHKNPELYKSQIAPLLEHGLLELLEGETEIAPGISTLDLAGHTPDQMGLWVASEPPILIAADALHYSWQLQYPEWINKLDDLPVLAAQSRKKLVDIALKHSAIVCATHASTPGVLKMPL